MADPPQPTTRRLAAILAADVVGYSRLIGADEDGALARLRIVFRETVQPAVTAQRGRIFKLMGDAFLAEFPSAVGAVLCAAALQEAMAAQTAEPRILLRIGVHLGDVVVEGSDLLGDGVNIAARLEGEAVPGGVAVSANVADSVRGRVPFALEDRGERTLKNIDRPMRVFRLAAPQAAPVRAAEPALTLPDKPSLVVLPFQNMSGDAEQDYFVDGLVEDITTALSCIRSFFVIARNSAFTYKGRAVDVRQVGRELGVRYVLEGSVRKAGGRIRITGQLVDATNGAHLWADRFDGALDDVFDLQDRVVESVAGAVEPQLIRAEIARSQHKPTQHLSAYDFFLRGMAAIHGLQPGLARQAQHFFIQSFALDPGFASAYGLAAWCLCLTKSGGALPEAADEISQGLQWAQRASELGKEDATALWTAGITQAYVGMNPEAGILLLERACTINPNSALAWSRTGQAQGYLGQAAKAISSFERAMRLSPRDPFRFLYLNGLAQAHTQQGTYDEAIAWAERSISDKPDWPQGPRVLASALVLSGRLDEGRRAMAELLRLVPTTRLLNWERFSGPLRNEEYKARLIEAYRLAGMPE